MAEQDWRKEWNWWVARVSQVDLSQYSEGNPPALIAPRVLLAANAALVAAQQDIERLQAALRMLGAAAWAIYDKSAWSPHYRMSRIANELGTLRRILDELEASGDVPSQTDETQARPVLEIVRD